jgi:hypothetical protein
MKKQTAVEWLIEKWSEQGTILNLDFDFALEIEKHQISMSHLEGAMKMHHKEFNSGDQYYEETYGKK